jgi:hypothetical protein
VGAKVKTWTKQRDDELRALSDKDLSGAQIGEILGVSRNTICGRKFRLGIRCAKPPKHFSEKDVSTLIRMRRAGKTALQIATTLKRSESSIYWKAHVLGITRRYSPRIAA